MMSWVLPSAEGDVTLPSSASLCVSLLPSSALNERPLLRHRYSHDKMVPGVTLKTAHSCSALSVALPFSEQQTHAQAQVQPLHEGASFKGEGDVEEGGGRGGAGGGGGKSQRGK